MNCIIVEDEIMARKSLEKLCEKSDILNLIGSYESAEAALEVFSKSEIALIFLDIEMPGMSGLELITALPYLPQIIFTTSNKGYAFEAFEYDVTDFLKKPVTQARFFKAVEKAQKREEQLSAIALSSKQSEIYVKTDGRLVRIAFHEILYFENVGDYIKAITELGNFIFHGTIKALDSRITHPRFLKVHRSYIVNLDKIKDIEDNTLVIEKKVIPISRAHKSILMRHINIL